ncbi:MAG: glutathione S-transferase family protein [Comamonas sp.]|jgi:glutathione S-transferase
MLSLYYAPGTCAQAVLIALNEAGANFEAKRLSLAEGEQRSPAYLAINPKGRVPTLVTPQGVLSETSALLLYVAQTHPAAQLAPLDDAFRLARMQEFNSYLASTVHVNHAHRTRAARWADDEAAQKAMKAKVPQNMHESFKVIEQHYLSDKPWVMGDQYTVSDGYLFTIAGWLKNDDVDIADFPRVAAHFERVRTRPAVQRALATA